MAFEEIIKELDTDAEYYAKLWVDMKKNKAEFNKDDILEIADAYVTLLNAKIAKLEHKED